MGVSTSIDYDSFKTEYVTTAKTSIKIYSLSDIHGDTKANSDYLQGLKPPKSDCFSIFICNGDLCTDVQTLRKSFQLLKLKFNEVCFVPGNHELWRRGTEVTAGSVKRGNLTYAKDSLVKFEEITQCAKQCDIRTGPLIVSSEHNDIKIHIYPLYSWYHSGFDTEDDLTNNLYLEYRQLVPFEMMWMDFRQCQWPPNIVSHSDFVNIEKNSTALASLFASINDSYLPAPNEQTQNVEVAQKVNNENTNENKSQEISPISQDDVVISFSHFVPRIELIPERRFLLEPYLARVSGSNFLECQIRKLKPDLHILGHTHIPIDMTLEGIRYIQWPLGYSTEHSTNCKETKSHGPLLLYDSTSTGFAPCRTDIECTDHEIHECHHTLKGILPDCIDSPTFHTLWTRYYREHCRTPNVTDILSPYLEEKLLKILRK